MYCARSVCVIRSSSRHFRIVFPGCSERAISPAIFSRSGNCMRPRDLEAYISVSKMLSTYADAHSEGRTPTKTPRSVAQRLYAGLHFARRLRVRGVAWSILGGSGPHDNFDGGGRPLDSGSNPDGPTLMGQ